VARTLALDTIVALAKCELAKSDGAHALAQGVIDMFAEALPCGFPEPEVYPNEVYITREMVGPWQPDDVQALAVALLRAAEKGREGV
jgi:hypothetical protein